MRSLIRTWLWVLRHILEAVVAVDEECPVHGRVRATCNCGGQVPCHINNFVNTVRACPRTGDLRFPFFPSIERSSSSCAGTRSGSMGSMR